MVTFKKDPNNSGMLVRQVQRVVIIKIMVFETPSYYAM